MAIMRVSWNEGRGRQVARKGDEGLEEGLDRLVDAHRDAERHGDDGGQQEAADDAPDGHADVVGEALGGEQVPTRGHRLPWRGEEVPRHRSAHAQEGPQRNEDEEERHAQGDATFPSDGDQQFHVHLLDIFLPLRSRGRERSLTSFGMTLLLRSAQCAEPKTRCHPERSEGPLTHMR
jgi:hypothetical protein